MQTFLPYPNFIRSAQCLDNKRLGKQRVEAFQLLVANEYEWALKEREQRTGKTSPPKGWRNHPAAVMWRGHEEALCVYMNLCIHEWQKRGFKNTMSIRSYLFNEFFVMSDYEDMVDMPSWLNQNDVHATHRSRLLFKGKLDLLAERIKLYTGDRGANRFIKQYGFKELNVFREDEYIIISEVLDKLNAPLIKTENYYHQFNWSEPDNLEYVWPTAITV